MHGPLHRQLNSKLTFFAEAGPFLEENQPPYPLSISQQQIPYWRWVFPQTLQLWILHFQIRGHQQSFQEQQRGMSSYNHLAQRILKGVPPADQSSTPNLKGRNNLGRMSYSESQPLPSSPLSELPEQQLQGWQKETIRLFDWLCKSLSENIVISKKKWIFRTQKTPSRQKDPHSINKKK